MSDEARRRGIDRTAKLLRESVIRNDNPDPGFAACVDRVRDARDLKDKQRSERG